MNIYCVLYAKELTEIWNSENDNSLEGLWESLYTQSGLPLQPEVYAAPNLSTANFNNWDTTPGVPGYGQQPIQVADSFRANGAMDYSSRVHNPITTNQGTQVLPQGKKFF